MTRASCDAACDQGTSAPAGAEAAPEARSPWAVLNTPLIGLILLYKATLSQFVGGHCRFHPTCSTYALEVCRRHNPIRASALTAWRLLRCQPLGGKGVDPAPAYRPR